MFYMNIDLLHKINDINVLVFGDYMVDKYINGSVSRISPEAPVPVIEVKSQTQKLGGAGNVINNILSLGGNVKVLGCIGKDSAGDFIVNYFNNNHTNVSYLKQYSQVNTIIKTRVVSKNQQFIRIDKEKKEPLLEEYFEYIKDNVDEIFSDVDVVVISDYAKGSVTSKVSKFLIENANKRNIPVIVDPKGKDYNKYKGANVCTPNVKELCDVLNTKVETEDDIRIQATELCKKIGMEYLALTRSEKGISLVSKTGIKQDFPAIAKDVIDVSGAGDTVVATMAVLLGLEFPLDEICKIANMAASVVVSKFGTATVSLNELICSISKTGEFKLQDVETLKYIVQDLKDKGKKVVFTNGCFDMLHVGHLSSFKEAKKYGDVLIVAVNSDASVKKNKGDLRPIIPEKDRIEMLCALEIVDYVVLMDDTNPVNLIEVLKPDISIKGEDWKDKIIPEKPIVEIYGGEMKFIKLNPNHSTTKSIEKVIAA